MESTRNIVTVLFSKVLAEASGAPLAVRLLKSCILSPVVGICMARRFAFDTASCS